MAKLRIRFSPFFLKSFFAILWPFYCHFRYPPVGVILDWLERPHVRVWRPPTQNLSCKPEKGDLVGLVSSVRANFMH